MLVFFMHHLNFPKIIVSSSPCYYSSFYREEIIILTEIKSPGLNP